jgi:hypothetical protein
VVNNASQDQVAVVAVGEDKDSHIDVTIRKSTAKYYDRRHTIRLEIDCETCYTRTSISLKQVKGSTEVTMVNYPSIAYNLEGI